MSHILNTDNGLYSYGSNEVGQLGLGNDSDRFVLQPTKLEFFNSHEILSVHCGGYHTIINTTGGVFGFGSSTYGQLISGDRRSLETPTKLEFFNNHEIISIHCGNHHTMIHTTDGLFVFGLNNVGQLGLSDRYNWCELSECYYYKYEPRKLEFFENRALEIISIQFLINSTFINTNDGLYVFGDNKFGQLGLGDYNDRNVPTKLDFFNNHEIISINGSEHTIIHTKTGIFVFGFNLNGQLGLGDNDNRCTPIKLKIFQRTTDPALLEDDHKILSIDCTGLYSMINTTDGLYVFGESDRCKKLGFNKDDALNDWRIPTKLNFFQRATDPALLEYDHEIISIYCSYGYVLINTTKGVYLYNDDERRKGLASSDNYHNKTIPTKLNLGDCQILSIYKCGFVNQNIINTTHGWYFFGCDSFELTNDNTYILKKIDFNHEIIPLTVNKKIKSAYSLV